MICMKIILGAAIAINLCIIISLLYYWWIRI